MVAAKRQQVKQGEEKEMLQGEDRDPKVTVNRLCRQVIQKVGSRARTAQATEAHRAWAQNVQERIRHYATVMSQEQVAEEDSSQEDAKGEGGHNSASQDKPAGSLGGAVKHVTSAECRGI